VSDNVGLRLDEGVAEIGSGVTFGDGAMVCEAV